MTKYKYAWGAYASGAAFVTLAAFLHFGLAAALCAMGAFTLLTATILADAVNDRLD